jgi:hypothetical protein
VRGLGSYEVPTPHPARGRYRFALATLSHKGRGEVVFAAAPAQ